jgi:phage virion morphogenesis protein
MDGVRIEVTLQDFPLMMAAFAGLAAASSDMTPLMEEIAFYGENSTKYRISVSNMGPDGVPWQPSLRVRRGGGHTLYESHRLNDSISSEATANQAMWGTNVIYARVHQEGATIHAKEGGKLRFELPGLGLMFRDEVTIPARPFLGFSSEDQEEIASIAGDYFARPFQQGGLQ